MSTQTFSPTGPLKRIGPGSTLSTTRRSQGGIHAGALFHRQRGGDSVLAYLRKLLYWGAAALGAVASAVAFHGISTHGAKASTAQAVRPVVAVAAPAAPPKEDAAGQSDCLTSTI